MQEGIWYRHLYFPLEWKVRDSPVCLVASRADNWLLIPLCEYSCPPKSWAESLWDDLIRTELLNKSPLTWWLHLRHCLPDEIADVHSFSSGYLISELIILLLWPKLIFLTLLIFRSFLSALRIYKNQFALLSVKNGKRDAWLTCSYFVPQQWHLLRLPWWVFFNNSPLTSSQLADLSLFSNCI